MNAPIFVDGHVHFYPEFDRTRFLDGALANFRAAAEAQGAKPELAGCLMFTEAAQDHYFRLFRDEASGGDAGFGSIWSFRRTSEPDSLVACRDGRDALLILAGRQIRTREGLEVSVLGRDAEHPGDEPLSQQVDMVLRDSEIAVLPWGFGKWWFGRGRLVKKEIARHAPNRIFLGDNGGRPRVFPTPALFGAAQARRVFILPGTDPLPLASEETRAGSFGFILNGVADLARPAQAIRNLLTTLTTQPETYGELQSLDGFLGNQIRMRFRARSSSS